jgi:outer membrane protein assembly factor BamB
VHANEPLAFFEGAWRIATDDHGVLTVRDATHGAVLAQADWTAAYTTPMAVALDGEQLLVRADGTHGVELCTTDGRTIWRRGYEIFAVHPGTSVIAGTESEPLLAVPRRDGVIDILRLRDGELVRELRVGDQAERRPVLAVGRLVLAGTLAGDLVAFDSTDGSEHWRRSYPAAIEALAAAAAADQATVAVATADGDVRLLTLGMS